tara:strand:+ start:4177 stop:4626 length:450 start_codon:yes stop_codon:yes gene_type:complete
MESEQFEKHLRAKEAIKDVLYFYMELLDYTGLYTDCNEFGKFDPEVYIDCVATEHSLSEPDAELLHEASAIKLLCSVFHLWEQNNYPKDSFLTTDLVKKLLDEGRIDHLPELKNILEKSLTSYHEAKELSFCIRQNYVVKFFAELIAER